MIAGNRSAIVPYKRQMNRRLFLGFPAIAMGAFAAPGKDFHARISTWMQYGPVPGAWITVVERGKVVSASGFGVRSVETQQPVDSQTIFEAASLTKQVTAYVAHSLVKEGKLDFDKPLNDYVPALPDAISKTVTSRHVLSHSSGWPNWRSESKDPLVPGSKPGERYRYSGEGYVYLSRVLEQVSDQPFPELVQRRVFDPLGMSSSSLVRLLDREDRMAKGHNGRGEPRDRKNSAKIWDLVKDSGKPITSWRYADSEALLLKNELPVLPNMMTINAAASMCTTGPDYAKFVLHAIKNPALRKRYTTIREGKDWSLGWGLGWGIEHVAGRDFLWQWGDNGGYKNFVILDPVAESGVFVFTNGDSGMRVCDRVVTAATGIEHPALLWLS
jgi:CubicO group peptidase (beta-lactamase class C family)